jgi:hypothetical protein
LSYRLGRRQGERPRSGAAKQLSEECGSDCGVVRY